MKRTITLKVDIPDTLEVQDMATVTLKDKDGCDYTFVSYINDEIKSNVTSLKSKPACGFEFPNNG